jgi:predicted HTH domain antitoxin
MTLPDEPVACRSTEAELRLELACAMYARGKLSKTAGAALAGVDLFTFQEALGERDISNYTVDHLHGEVEALRECFPLATTVFSRPGLPSGVAVDHGLHA